MSATATAVNWWSNNPCIGGHVWNWVSSTTAHANPPDHRRCECGRYTWAEINEKATHTIQGNDKQRT